MKKIIAVILTLAMMCCLGVSAFAADGEGVGSDGNFSSGSATTTVSIKFSTDSSQLSASVPLAVTLAVKNDKSIVAPANTAYKITSTCLIPIHVSGISVTTSSGVKLVTNTPAADGEIKLALKAGTDSIALAAPTAATAAPQTIGTAAQWNIAASETLGLTFENGAVYNIPSAWATTATQIFTVTYTLAAGSAT